MLTRCPHCGDERSGYSYECLALDARAGLWGEPSESVGVGMIKRYPKMVYCLACGKRVRRVDAEKYGARE